jgi:hypothetical protein
MQNTMPNIKIPITNLHVTLEHPVETVAPGYQGFGSGSGLDPDSVTLWIRIRIGNPDPGPSGPGARKLRNFSGKMHFLVV